MGMGFDIHMLNIYHKGGDSKPVSWTNALFHKASGVTQHTHTIQTRLR